MTFKERYGNYNESISPAPALISGLEEAAQERRTAARRGVFRTVRAVATAAAAVICLGVVMPTLAMSVTPIYRLMYLVSPEVAQFFRPVQMTDEHQGIRMEVVSAYIHENEAQIYITLQDLEGDRIDATTDLYDSYSINTPFSSSGGCRSVGYDPETGKATFLITISQWGGKNIEGEKITFSVREFLSHKESNEDLLIPISLSEAEKQPATMTATLRGFGGDIDFKMAHEDMVESDGMGHRITSVLVPQPDNGVIPLDGIEFTGMGYVDGLLHIQHAVPDSLLNDNHGYFFLVDGSGQERLYDCNMGFWGQADDTRSTSYEDYVFDISPEELSDYTLHGYFVTSGFRMEGNWSVTFPLEQEKE